MENPERLIESLLENEHRVRIDALKRAKHDKASGSDVYVPDYEDDFLNIEEAIRLWRRVRP